MLVGLIRFLRGYVNFTAKGKFPERFLNITARYGINLWEARPSEKTIEASMYISEYRKIRFAARKAGVVTKIKEKHGLPFFIFKYRPRIGIPIGAAAGLVLIIVLSNFIWSVSITGAKNVSETRILQALAENGVKTGGYKNNLDVKKIERDTMLEIGEIGWMSVNLTGNIASVEIKEKSEKPKLKNNLSPCNIKAARDGVITKVNAKRGETKITAGSGVAKGDLLVSGITETKLNTIQYMRAEAEVFADVEYKKDLSIKKKYNYFYAGDEKIQRNRAFLLWCDIPCSMVFSSYSNSVYSEKTQSVVLNGVALPLGLRTETQSRVYDVSAKPDINKARKAFLNELMLYEVFEKSESGISDRKITVSENKDGFFCSAEYVFNENIAQSVDFDVTD